MCHRRLCQLGSVLPQGTCFGCVNEVPWAAQDLPCTLHLPSMINSGTKEPYWALAAGSMAAGSGATSRLDVQRVLALVGSLSKEELTEVRGGSLQPADTERPLVGPAARRWDAVPTGAMTGDAETHQWVDRLFSCSLATRGPGSARGLDAQLTNHMRGARRSHFHARGHQAPPLSRQPPSRCNQTSRDGSHVWQSSGLVSAGFPESAASATQPSSTSNISAGHTASCRGDGLALHSRLMPKEASFTFTLDRRPLGSTGDASLALAAAATTALATYKLVEDGQESSCDCSRSCTSVLSILIRKVKGLAVLACKQVRDRGASGAGGTRSQGGT